MAEDIRLTSGTIWKAAAIVAFTFTVIHLVGAVTAILLVIFGGIILGCYLSGIACLIRDRTPLGYRASIATVYLVHLALLAALVPWWMSQGQPQAERLADELPAAVSHLSDQLESTSWGAWLVAQAEHPQELFNPNGGGLALGLRRFLSGAAGVLTAFGVLLFVGIYVGADPDAYRRGILRLVPLGRRERASEVLAGVTHTLRMWVVGRLIGAVVIGAGVALGLWLIGIPLPIMLGVLAGALTFIPNFGPVISVIPPALLALTQSPHRVLYVLALFGGLQLVESYFLTPMIQKRAVEVPPALLLASQIAFGVLLGVVGLVLAAPLTAAIMVLVRELYVRDALGDDSLDDVEAAEAGDTPGVDESEERSDRWDESPAVT